MLEDLSEDNLYEAHSHLEELFYFACDEDKDFKALLLAHQLNELENEMDWHEYKEEIMLERGI